MITSSSSSLGASVCEVAGRCGAASGLIGTRGSKFSTGGRLGGGGGRLQEKYIYVYIYTVIQ